SPVLCSLHSVCLFSCVSCIFITIFPSVPSALIFFFLLFRPPSSTLFPYTTLFRSRGHAQSGGSRSSGRAGSNRSSRSIRPSPSRSEEHTSALQSRFDLVCRLLPDKKMHRNFIIAALSNAWVHSFWIYNTFFIERVA